MESKTKRCLVSKWYVFYICTVLAIIVFWVYARFILHVCFVTGESMYPTYNNGDILQSTVSFQLNDIKRGDIVVLNTSNGKLIKRVVALPGEYLYVRDGQIYVSTDKVNYSLTGFEFESIEDSGVIPLSDKDPLSLSKSEFFCIGDNRNNSIDCRIIGPVEFADIERLVTNKLFGNISFLL